MYLLQELEITKNIRKQVYNWLSTVTYFVFRLHFITLKKAIIDEFLKRNML